MRFIFITFLISSIVLKSQNDTKSIFSLNPALGLNGCQIHGDSYSGYDKLGLFSGIAVNALINKKLSFDIGFYFSQKGARHNPVPSKGDFSYYRVNLNYLEIPLIARYQLNSIYFASIGPSIAYLINYNENINYIDFTGFYPFNKLESGINFGIGRSIFKNKFLLELRSSNSFMPVRDYGKIANLVFYPNPLARFFNKGLYNNILTLFVSYKINFKSHGESN
jgi:hypothetical protein